MTSGFLWILQCNCSCTFQIEGQQYWCSANVHVPKCHRFSRRANVTKCYRLVWPKKWNIVQSQKQLINLCEDLLRSLLALLLGELNPQPALKKAPGALNPSEPPFHALGGNWQAAIGGMIKDQHLCRPNEHPNQQKGVKLSQSKHFLIGAKFEPTQAGLTRWQSCPHMFWILYIRKTETRLIILQSCWTMLNTSPE